MGAETTATDLLSRIAALIERDIDACAHFAKFLDNEPVLATLEIDRSATERAGYAVFVDQPSKDLLKEGSALGIATPDVDLGPVSHGDAHVPSCSIGEIAITPEMIEAGAKYLSHRLYEYADLSLHDFSEISEAVLSAAMRVVPT